MSPSEPQTLNAKLHRIGKNVAIFVPEQILRSTGLLPEMPIRILLLNGEIRVRRASSLRAYDLESLEEYRERQFQEEAERGRGCD